MGKRYEQIKEDTINGKLWKAAQYHMSLRNFKLK